MSWSVTVATMVSVIAIVMGNVPDTPSLSVPSKELFNFLHMLSGHFSNKDQVKQDDAEREQPHDLLDVMCRPVTVPALYPAFTFLFEEDIYNKVNRLELWVISFVKKSKQNLINIARSNIPQPENYIPGSYDVEQLKTIKKEDLVFHKDCEIIFKYMENNFFFGTFPHCLNNTNAQKGQYDVTLNCLAFSGVVSSSIKEKGSAVPYELFVTERYPLPPYMLQGTANFENPCKK